MHVNLRQNANIVSIRDVGLMQRIGIEPILCICIQIVCGNTMLQFDANANVDASVNEALGFIYIRLKANAKAMLLPICYIVSNLCIYTTATAMTANIKEKNRFHVRFRSNINEPLCFSLRFRSDVNEH